MFVSTKVVFLEDDKSKGRIDLRETRGEPTDPPVIENNVRQENATSSPISATVPRHSGRIISQPDRYMFLEEAFQAVSKEFESDLTMYKEAMTNVVLAH